MYNKEDILRIAHSLRITFDKFSLNYLITGINIQLEHGLNNNLTNVTLKKL